jgi:tetratricopeptide (TPR) repeat protein
MLATTRHDLKDLAGAEKAYLRLLSMAPREIKGLNGIGVLYGELGDLDKSLYYLRQAAQIAPGDPNTLVNYGYAAFLKGELHDSRDALNRALAANPALSARIVPVLMEIARRQNDREELERLQSLTGQGI